ncbi:MAG: hypothetical protein NPINA01_12410 [Nitrospinaceae bacterium]|nr:MAG: hypothetical protein NPINA01_12410 [Nitrospinaceae bacterium]
MAQAEEIVEEPDPSAQETEDLDEDVSQEPEELERLLEATQNPDEEGEGGKDESSPEEGKRFLFSKKFWILVGGGVFLLVALAVGAYFFLPSTELEGEEPSPAPTAIETTKPTFNKVDIYALQPFFLPLKAGNKETGSFISFTPHLVMSNNTLDKEIEKSLPSIRKNIYTILIRKSPKDYFLRKGAIKETIKKEILTAVNPLLLAGTGTITDVVFTQFVVK